MPPSRRNKHSVARSCNNASDPGRPAWSTCLKHEHRQACLVSRVDRRLSGGCRSGRGWLLAVRTNNVKDAFITFRTREIADGLRYGAWNLDGARVDAHHY